MRNLRVNGTPARPSAARVLVIDDSPSVFYSVKAALSPDGHFVERLGCFVDLPGRIAENPPNLILLDLHIPELPGIAMGKYIRSHQPRYIPILIYSGAPLNELERAMREIHADGAIPKDTPPDALRDRVRAALQVRK
ncbi:MAG: response regulator [Polyangiaceae bacterium]|nr:response regulator [Polyangiaceae bacterium]NUQ78348.1 response regulator [Polyangiaceae bacterium]